MKIQCECDIIEVGKDDHDGMGGKLVMQDARINHEEGGPMLNGLAVRFV